MQGVPGNIYHSLITAVVLTVLAIFRAVPGDMGQKGKERL